MTLREEYGPRGLAMDMAAAHRLCAIEGFVEGLWNHISIVLEQDSLRMLVTPNNMHWGIVRASDLLEIDGDGRRLSGTRWPNLSTAIIHAPVHEARPDAACLIHVHATHSTALFMRERVRLQTRSSQAAAGFHGRVAYFDVYDGPLTHRSEGERMAKTLGDADVLVLRNHGILVAGRSIAEAYSRLHAFERACQLQLLAQPADQPLSLIPEQIVRAMETAEATIDGMPPEDASAEWEGWCEMLDITDPSYRL